MKRMYLIGITCLMLCLAVGCTAAPSPSPTPARTPASTPTPSQAQMTQLPTLSPENGAGLSNEDRAGIESEIAKLSEVKEASVFGQDETLLVGILYDDAYQGKMNDRLQSMIEEAVTGSNKAYTQILVTDDETLVEEIRKLADGSGQTDFETLRTQMQNAPTNTPDNSLLPSMMPQTTTGSGTSN